MSSLVYIQNGGRKAVTQEKRRQLASIANVRFIKLIHKEICSTTRSVMGFQSVTITSYNRAGGRHVQAAWNKQQGVDGELMDAPKGELVFMPDEFQQGIGYLPDSPYNRNKLSATFYNGLWNVADERTREELRPLADRMREEDKLIEKSKRVGVFIDTEKSVLAKENKDLMDRIKNLEEMQDVKPFTPPKPISNMPQVEAVISPERQLKDDKIFTSLKKQAKTQVYDEMCERVSEIKQALVDKNGHDRGWAATDEYKAELAPVIEERTRALLKVSNPDVFARMTNGHYPKYSSDD